MSITLRYYVVYDLQIVPSVSINRSRFFEPSYSRLDWASQWRYRALFQDRDSSAREEDGEEEPCRIFEANDKFGTRVSLSSEASNLSSSVEDTYGRFALREHISNGWFAGPHVELGPNLRSRRGSRRNIRRAEEGARKRWRRRKVAARSDALSQPGGAEGPTVGGGITTWAS